MNCTEHRSQKGMSLVEMLATMLIMGFVAAAIAEIVVTQNVVAFRTSNKLDALINARRIVSYIERDIHNAYIIGSSTVPQNQFTGSSVYTLSGHTLIVQTPIFYDAVTTGGIPNIPMWSGKNWNVDTTVYEIVGDPSRKNTGQFLLQRTIYPGSHPAGDAPNVVSQSLLTGIVGPVDSGQTLDPIAGVPYPKVFGYFSKTTPIYTLSPTAAQIQMPLPNDISGISLNLEIMSNSASSRIDLTPHSMAFRAEAFLRSNGYQL